MNESKHAQRVIDNFKGLLSPAAHEHVGKNHLDQLGLMIEAAIDASTVDVLEEYAGKVADIAREMRDRAEKP